MINKFGETIEQEEEYFCINQTKLRSAIHMGGTKKQ